MSPVDEAFATDRWRSRPARKARRLEAVAGWLRGKVLARERVVEALERLLKPGDRVALEGNNQKQADFLSRSLAQVDPAVVHDLHLLISSISRPEHLALFDRGIARKIDFAYAGPQSLRVPQLLEDGKLELGAIHTYVELYARMFVDLTPSVALICAEPADAQGNLYTGPNTEDTPTIVEATAFRHGVVEAPLPGAGGNSTTGGDFRIISTETSGSTPRGDPVAAGSPVSPALSPEPRASRPSSPVLGLRRLEPGPR